MNVPGHILHVGVYSRCCAGEHDDCPENPTSNDECCSLHSVTPLTLPIPRALPLQSLHRPASFCVCAAAPWSRKCVPKPVLRLVHVLARPGLAVDAQTAASHPKNHAATVRKRQSTDQQVRSPRGRIDIVTHVLHDDVPELAVDQRDLPAAALVGVADDTASGSKRCPRDRVHRAAVGALDPDCLESTCCHGLREGTPALSSDARQHATVCQNVAIGLTGEPVPPRIGSGATVSRNSHRFRAAAASASASRSQLSNRCTPERHQRKVVHGASFARDVGRRRARRDVAPEQGNISRFQPRKNQRAWSRPLAFATDVPRPDGRSPRPSPRANEQSIARRHFQARHLSHASISCSVIRRSAQIRHTLEPRNVDQDAAREDPVLEIDDRVPRMAACLHHRGRVWFVAVVENAVVVDVRQRVEVGMSDAVECYANRSDPIASIWRSYGCGLSTAFSVSTSRASETENPSFTSAAACRRFAGVIRFTAPI